MEQLLIRNLMIVLELQMLVMAARLSISLKLINQERERVPGEPLLLQESILVKEGKERLVELSITIS